MNHISPTQMMSFVEELHEIEKAAGFTLGRQVFKAPPGAIKQTAGKVGDWLRRFGKRQLYTLTGRGVKDVEEAKRLGLVSRAKPPPGGARTSVKARRKYEKALEQERLGEEAFQRGHLSVPGAVHGLLTSPVQTLKSGWQRGGIVGKGFAGLGAYETGKAALTPTEPGGPGKAQRVLGAAGSTLGWMVAPATLAGGMLMGSGAERVGKAIGGAADTAADIARGPGVVAPGPRARPEGNVFRRAALSSSVGGGRGTIIRGVARPLLQGAAQAASPVEGIR
jgi:hypothetical protein